MSKTQDQTRSISDKISALAKKLNAPHAKLLTELLIERLVVRLLRDRNLASQLVFKGGYVSLRVYNSPRYTIDLDTLLKKGTPENILKTAVTAAEADLSDGVWFRFEKTVDLETQGEYEGLRIVFRSGIGEVPKNPKKVQTINLDIGVGDAITPGPLKIETPFLLGGGTLSWQVYPLETTVAEKLHALIVRGSESSRSKDIFDLCRFLPKCDPSTLKKALKETFKSRGDAIPEDIVAHIQEIDRTILKKGWASAVADISEAGSFDEEFETCLRSLKIIWQQS